MSTYFFAHDFWPKDNIKIHIPILDFYASFCQDFFFLVFLGIKVSNQISPQYFPVYHFFFTKSKFWENKIWDAHNYRFFFLVMNYQRKKIEFMKDINKDINMELTWFKNYFFSLFSVKHWFDKDLQFLIQIKINQG